MNETNLSKNQLRRLPIYLSYLKEKYEEGTLYISSPQIASGLSLNEELVRKDLASVSSKDGKPKLGRNINELIDDIESFLVLNESSGAILVGTGQLGKALLSYKGFANYGLNIVAAFDNDESLLEKKINGITVYPDDEMYRICHEGKISIGIITVPQQCAQEACDKLIKSGVKAIWNFAPIHLDVPKEIIVQNENMASSLAILSNKLKLKIKKGEL